MDGAYPAHERNPTRRDRFLKPESLHLLNAAQASAALDTASRFVDRIAAVLEDRPGV